LAGMGIGNVVLPPLVKRWFPHRVGTLSVVYITALQAGTILSALAAVPLADAFGWRVSLGAWAFTAVAAMLPWWLLRRADAPGTDRSHLPARTEAAGDDAPAAGAIALDSTPDARSRVWHTALGWGMALMF